MKSPRPKKLSNLREIGGDKSFYTVLRRRGQSFLVLANEKAGTRKMKQKTDC